MKGHLMTPREITYAVKLTTQKVKIKYYEMSISYLYSINQFNIIEKKFSKKKINLTKKDK
jgi:hypothetical protein